VVRNRMPGGVRGNGGDPVTYSMVCQAWHAVPWQALFDLLWWQVGRLGGASPLQARQGELLAGRQVSEDSEVNIVRCWLKEAAGR